MVVCHHRVVASLLSGSRMRAATIASTRLRSRHGFEASNLSKRRRLIVVRQALYVAVKRGLDDLKCFADSDEGLTFESAAYELDDIFAAGVKGWRGYAFGPSSLPASPRVRGLRAESFDCARSRCTWEHIYAILAMNTINKAMTKRVTA